MKIHGYKFKSQAMKTMAALQVLGILQEDIHANLNTAWRDGLTPREAMAQLNEWLADLVMKANR